MTLRVCMDCTTAFAVGVPRCPHCGSERSAEEGTAQALGVFARGRVEEEPMPKITRHGGPSDRHAEQGPEAAASDVVQPAEETPSVVEEQPSEAAEETPAPPVRKRQQRRKT